MTEPVSPISSLRRTKAFYGSGSLKVVMRGDRAWKDVVEGLEGHQGGGMCAICHEEGCGEGQGMVLTLCGHPFHPECLSEWIKTLVEQRGTPACPLCRCEIPL